MKIRNLTENDYDILVEWWKKWRWTPPPRDFLPQNGTGGYMIEIDGIPVVAGFIYLTNSSVAWSEFIISNFDYKNKENRKEAICILIHELTTVAKECGAKYVYTVVKNSNLKNLYSEMGFTIGSTKVDEMFCII